MYSVACHALGALYAVRVQSQAFDWRTAALVQATVTVTHLFAHYTNEWADFEADRLNRNAGGWTGGSQVLARGLLPRVAAAYMSALTALLAVVCGVLTVVRFLDVRLGVAPASLLSVGGFRDALLLVPWQFVAVGFAVLAVAAAYSLPPLRLSANALGELCVAFVLSFAAPAVGLLTQNGRITPQFVEVLLPFILLSFARMVVMNIADRDGDAKANKFTSVVWLGEPRAVALVNAMHAATYLVVIPQLSSLPYAIRVAYYTALPLRWWQSIRLNAPDWWLDAALVRSLPFVESLFVLSNSIILCIALATTTITI
jgi:1,4-dihydroxy-2-naphthoate octaprenyltransferase